MYLIAGGQTCSGINDEARGIQLSYMNGDSNGWMQISFYSDTILYAVSVILHGLWFKECEL